MRKFSSFFMKWRQPIVAASISALAFFALLASTGESAIRVGGGFKKSRFALDRAFKVVDDTASYAIDKDVGKGYAYLGNFYIGDGTNLKRVLINGGSAVFVTVTADTLTDGVLVITDGAITLVEWIDTDSITANRITDGTIYIENGRITDATYSEADTVTNKTISLIGTAISGAKTLQMLGSGASAYIKIVDTDIDKNTDGDSASVHISPNSVTWYSSTGGTGCGLSMSTVKQMLFQNATRYTFDNDASLTKPFNGILTFTVANANNGTGAEAVVTTQIGNNLSLRSLSPSNTDADFGNKVVLYGSAPSLVTANVKASGKLEFKTGGSTSSYIWQTIESDGDMVLGGNATPVANYITIDKGKAILKSGEGNPSGADSSLIIDWDGIDLKDGTGAVVFSLTGAGAVTGSAISDGSGSLSAVRDSVDLHKTRIENAQDSLGVHRTEIDNLSDSIGVHLGSIGALEDSIGVHRTAIDNAVDSLGVHRTELDNAADSLGVHRTEIDNAADSLGVHRTEIDNSSDSLGVHRTEIDNSADSLGVHRTAIDNLSDSIGVHLTRFVENEDSLGVHRTEIDNINDSLGVHLTRFVENEDSLGVHRTAIDNINDSLGVHLTRFVENEDSLGVHRTAIDTINDSLGVHLGRFVENEDSLYQHLLRIQALEAAGGSAAMDSINVHRGEIDDLSDSIGVHLGSIQALEALTPDQGLDTTDDVAFKSATLDDSLSFIEPQAYIHSDSTLAIRLKKTNGFLEIIRPDGSGHLAVGRTTATAPSFITVTDGGADNEPGTFSLYKDDGNATYLWPASNGVLRVRASMFADDDADGYSLIDVDDGTIGSSTQNVNGSTITGSTAIQDGTGTLSAVRDSVALHKTRIENAQDSLTAHLNRFVEAEDSLGVHRTAIDTINDSLGAHLNRFVEVEDSLGEHLSRFVEVEDSLGVHRTAIDLANDSLGVHLTRFVEVEDSLGEHLNRFVEVEDSLAEHLARFVTVEDSLAEHLARFVEVEDSIGVHRTAIDNAVDSLAQHLGRIQVLEDSSGNYDERISAVEGELPNKMGDTHVIPTVNYTYSSDVKEHPITAREQLVFGDIIYKTDNGEWNKCDADYDTMMIALGIVVSDTIDADGTGYMITEGYLFKTSWNWTLAKGVNNLLYADDGTSGAVVLLANKPNDSGDVLQVVGWVHNADVIYFKPSLVWVKVE